MFIVTGASGRLGRQVVEWLLTLVSPERIGASVRNRDAISDLAAKGVRVRHGDYDDLASLGHSFEGAKRILIVSSNADAYGGNAFAQHQNAILAAKNAGVERIFYTSQMSASPVSHFPPGRAHAATEALLAQSGVPWTSLRHGFYAESAMMMYGDGLKQGKLAIPSQGPVAWTTHADLAEADARYMLDPTVRDGPTPSLTGRIAYSLNDLVDIAQGILEKPISLETVTEEALLERVRARDLSQAVIEIQLGYYRAARADEFAETTSVLEKRLGRVPQTMPGFMREWFAGSS